ncbi:secreted protein [Melampsora americana]|nr:secreted protein [Melampsora americana]
MISRGLNCFLMVVSLIFSVGLSSAATSNAATVKFCPIRLQKTITEEISALDKEVKNMNVYVTKLAESKERRVLLDVAYKAICSELMQNASRLKLFHKAGKDSKKTYKEIKGLIDQIVILLQNFIIEPSIVVKNAPKLAKAITEIRAKAKPRKNSA